MCRRILLPLAASLLLGVGACSPREDTGPPHLRAPVRESDGSTLSEEECREVGLAIEKAVRAGDAAEFSALMDWQALLDVATIGIDAPSQLRESFARDFLGVAAQNPNSALRQMLEPIARGATFTLLGVPAEAHSRRARFRLLHPDASFTYYDVLLDRRGKAIKGVDIYMYSNGELLSQAARRQFVPLAARVHPDLTTRLRG